MLLENKTAIIVGLLSDRSIAYGIAKALHAQGARLAFTYQSDNLKERVQKLAAAFNPLTLLPLDVTKEEDIQALPGGLTEVTPQIDTVIHSVAFAPADQLTGDYHTQVNRAGFLLAHEISSYSLAALAKALTPMMPEGGNILTLTYLGAERVIPNYNTMGVAKASLEANVRYLAASLGPKGIRVNGISAGPIRTLAASGIKSFRKMLNFHESHAPMRSLTTLEQVGNTALFLSSDWASGITGEIIHVDNGYHITGVPPFVEENAE